MSAKKDLIIDLIIDTNEETAFIPDHTLKVEPQEILYWPDKRLKTISEKVVDFDNEDSDLMHLVVNMLGVIIPRGGLALAAPQIGIFKRVIVMTLGGKIYVMVNPEIVETSETESFQWEEGCLSVPGFFKKTKRPNKCTVEYFDIRGELFTAKLEGLASFCIQHEIDHLDGKCFTDELSSYYKNKAKKKINTYKKEVEVKVKDLQRIYIEKAEQLRKITAKNPKGKPRSRKIFPDTGIDKDGILNLS